GEFVVESIDSEGVRNRYAVPLSPLRKDEQSYIIGYTKPGSTQGEFTVTAQVNGRAIATNQDNFPALELEQQLFVTIGSTLPGLRRAVSPTPDQVQENAADEAGTFRETGPRRETSLEDFRMLPNRWFAYDGAHLVVLSSVDRDLLP